MKRCLMITGGKLSLEFAEKFLEGRSYEFVIAADAGLASAGALGIRPDVAVGDFDTLGKTRLQEYRSAHSVPLDIHRPEKDETDTELAFLTAFRHGCTSMDILGATGGRLDHEISNIHLLAMGLRHGVSASIYDQQNRIYLLDAAVCGRKKFRKEEMYGSYISFLPFTESVKGITLTGFRYPLCDKDISVFENPSLCVSNELAADEATLEFREGMLLCVESGDLAE